MPSPIASIARTATLCLGLAAATSAQTWGPGNLTCVYSNFPGMTMTTYAGSYAHDGYFGNGNDPDQIHLGSMGLSLVNGQNCMCYVDLTFRTARVYVPILGVWFEAIFTW